MSGGGWRAERPGLSEVRSEQAGSEPQLSASWKITTLRRPGLPAGPASSAPSAPPTSLNPTSPAPASSLLLKGLQPWHKGPGSTPTLGLLEPEGGPLATLGNTLPPAPWSPPTPARTSTQDSGLVHAPSKDTEKPGVRTFPEGKWGHSRPPLPGETEAGRMGGGLQAPSYVGPLHGLEGLGRLS